MHVTCILLLMYYELKWLKRKENVLVPHLHCSPPKVVDQSWSTLLWMKHSSIRFPRLTFGHHLITLVSVALLVIHVITDNKWWPAVGPIWPFGTLQYNMQFMADTLEDDYIYQQQSTPYLPYNYIQYQYPHVSQQAIVWGCMHRLCSLSHISKAFYSTHEFNIHLWA